MIGEEILIEIADTTVFLSTSVNTLGYTGLLKISTDSVNDRPA